LTQASAESTPCTSCGACCARFRVSFYSEERVPEGYSYEVAPFERALKTKTDAEGRPRCIALRGEIGSNVGCGIYAQRPTPCREFKYSYEDGGPREPRCDQAREAIGLSPLQPAKKPTLINEVH
jgi:Fe-S-cluster containining protein